MPRQPAAIDREKLRAAVRKLGHEHVFYMPPDLCPAGTTCNGGLCQ